MGNFLSKLFDYSFDCCKRHKLFFSSLLVATVIIIVIAVFGGIKLQKSMFPQNFSNVAYIKFLKSSSGFVAFMFNSLFTNFIFVGIIWTTSCRSWSIWIGILFYLYFVYAQVVTIISISMEFGFFNTIIIVIYISIMTIIYIFLYLMIIMDCGSCCNNISYFSVSIKLLVPMLLTFVFVIVANSIFLMSLRNFVIILVYK